jgi:hypothetical protein
MESRICGHCGQQFFTPTKSEKADDKFFPFGMIVFPLLAFYFIEKGGLWWIGVMLCVLVVIGGIMDKIDSNKQKKGKLVSPNRICPSCDEKSADVDSPLGRQLIEQWSVPPSVDHQDVASGPSTIPCVGDHDCEFSENNR